jgi:hypothetical protein
MTGDPSVIGLEILPFNSLLRDLVFSVLRRSLRSIRLRPLPPWLGVAADVGLLTWKLEFLKKPLALMGEADADLISRIADPGRRLSQAYAGYADQGLFRPGFPAVLDGVNICLEDEVAINYVSLFITSVFIGKRLRTLDLMIEIIPSADVMSLESWGFGAGRGVT